MLNLALSGRVPPWIRAQPAEFHEPSSVLHVSLTRCPITRNRRRSKRYLNEAWAEARHDGVDGDCLAQASLFAAFAELVGTYGEDAVAKFVEGLPVRVRNGEFSTRLAKQ